LTRTLEAWLPEIFPNTVATRILEAGQIEHAPASAVPELRLPGAGTLFSERAARLRQLAQTSTMADYLRFIALVAARQETMMQSLSGTPLPDQARIAQCHDHAMPPLQVTSWQRNAKWRLALRGMLLDLAAEVSGKSGDVVARLAQASEDFIEAQASKICAGIDQGLDVAAAPLIGAGLQAYWASMASRLAAGDVGRSAAPNLCPVCGSLPVASIVRIGGEEAGYRYLHCSLCSSEWHMVRIKCTQCQSTKGIGYHGIAGGNPAVKAESCEQCRSYLKILYMEKDAAVEPTADDLASLPLDILMAEENFARSGTNMMLFHGSS
jgi:FdhE protein